MDYGGYLSLIRSVDDLIRIIEDHPDERTREQVTALLTGIDALHREGLERLLGRLRDFAGEELVERVAADPVVETLLGLYGLRELEAVGPPERPRDGVPAGFVPAERLRAGRPRRPAPPEEP